MKIRIDSITFQNILSFGNKSTTLDITQGLTAITGSNGAGKSSLLLDTISFCLFGKPYRKIKIEKLINRKNKKGLLVECNLTIDNKSTLKITRGLSPSILTIHKDGEPITLLSSKKLNQSEIDDIIGINYELFKQIISLSINYNKPFITLESKDKRDLIEQLFNIKIFGEMLKNIKKESSDLRIQFDANTKILDISKENLIQLKSRVSDIDNAVANFTKSKKDDLQSTKTELSESEAELTKVLDSIPVIESNIKSISVIDSSELKSEKTSLIKQISAKESLIALNKKTIKHLESNDVCTSCNHKISKEHKESETVRCNTEIQQYESDIIKLTAQCESVDVQIDENDENKSKKQKLEYELDSLNKKVSSIKDRNTKINENIEKINNRTIDINVSAIKKEFKEKQTSYKVLSATQSDIKEKIDINKEVASILSDNGIKKYIIEKIVPFLNQSVNSYLEYFDMPIRLDFNSEMEETIKLLGHHSEDESYYSFSEGEKKRIDMSILLSFIKLTKILSNWNCNLLIIDELLDSSIDDAGLDKLLKSFKKIAKEDGEQGIFIISHKLHNEHISNFDRIMKIEKSTIGFSSIKDGV